MPCVIFEDNELSTEKRNIDRSSKLRIRLGDRNEMSRYSRRSLNILLNFRIRVQRVVGSKLLDGNQVFACDIQLM